MHISDNLSNGEKQNTTVKMPHMFQRINEEAPKTNSNTDEVESQVIKNMSKIAKTFKSDQTSLEFEQDQPSLVFSTNKLIEINLINSTKPLFDYFEEIRNLINPKVEVNVVEEEFDIIEEFPTEVEEIEEKIINIDDIIKDSEKVIFNSHDKKSLLKELINDVSSNSSVNFTYDDEKFEKNIKEMLSEMNDQNDNEDTILIDAISPIVEDVQAIKKSKLSIFLILTIIILLGYALYIYKDTLLKLLSEF